jgi:hypothetical protein
VKHGQRKRDATRAREHHHAQAQHGRGQELAEAVVDDVAHADGRGRDGGLEPVAARAGRRPPRAAVGQEVGARRRHPRQRRVALRRGRGARRRRRRARGQERVAWPAGRDATRPPPELRLICIGCGRGLQGCREHGKGKEEDEQDGIGGRRHVGVGGVPRRLRIYL